MEHLGNILRRSLGGMSDWPLLATVTTLVTSENHGQDVTRQRATMILARVHLFAIVFGGLTLGWTIVDAFVFEPEVWQPVALGRIAAATAFGALAIFTLGLNDITKARTAMALMFLIPMAFYAISYPFLADVKVSGIAEAAYTTYTLMPFIVVCGLVFLPVTLIEGLVFAVPVLVASHVIQLTAETTYDVYVWLGVKWLFILVAFASILAGMSQLQLIIELARQASSDALTKAFVRRVGQELLEAQFNAAERQDSPFAVAFADIDDFKSVNDQFGHEIGDKVLSQTADQLQQILRKSDRLVRWGGEEFLVIMPNTDHAGAAHMIERLYDQGLGLRPDGSSLTVSIGVAERQTDDCPTSDELVALADSRMYEAKQAGKNRFVTGEPDIEQS